MARDRASACRQGRALRRAAVLSLRVEALGYRFGYPEPEGPLKDSLW